MTMSSLRGLRQRLNKSEHEYHGKDSKNVTKSNRSSSVNSTDVFEIIIEQPEQSKNGQNQIEDSHQNKELEESSQKWQNLEEKKIFEEQLNHLHEQLMAAMIENQNLKSELKSSQNLSELEKMKTLLEYERHRSEMLEKKCLRESKKIRSLVTDGNEAAVLGAGHDNSKINRAAYIDEDDNGESFEITTPVKGRLFPVLLEWLNHLIYTVFDDFTDEPMADSDVDPDENHLSVKTLKENIKRFGSEAKPYVNTVKGIYSLLAWKSPPYTLIVFVLNQRITRQDLNVSAKGLHQIVTKTSAAMFKSCLVVLWVYMYSVWNGWFLPVLLFCLSFRLFINFLKHKGWNVNFNFFETLEEPKDVEEKELGVADKFNLIMHVARKVQNILGEVADYLEKIKSLLTWRHPEASQHAFIIINTAFIISCFMPTATLFFYGGLSLGIKLFIIDYIFNRFPRIRRKYDSTWRLWNELPTDIEFEKRHVQSEIDKSILHHSHEKGDVNAQTKSGHVSVDSRTFCELFSLPESEYPLPGWHGGRRCTLINKDKSFTAAFKHGRLFLTPSFLCFERTKMPSLKNIVIPLANIIRLEKVKPFGWMPGGMGIELSVVGKEKPYLFGAIINRDEIFEGILKAGRTAGLSWSAASAIIN